MTGTIDDDAMTLALAEARQAAAAVEDLATAEKGRLLVE